MNIINKIGVVNPFYYIKVTPLFILRVIGI